jgi:hypothetical protein
MCVKEVTGESMSLEKNGKYYYMYIRIQKLLVRYLVRELINFTVARHDCQ